MKRDVRFPARHGFTLIELLVVITIIAILAALTMQVIGGMMANANRAATSATLNKIQGRIRDRIQTLGAVDMDQYKILATSDPLSPSTDAEKTVLAKKILFREAFPQNWVEFEYQWPDQYAEIFAEATQKNKPNAPNVASAADSAEVLYYTLTRGPIPGKGKRKLISGAAPVAADEFYAQDVGDTDEDGLSEFIDAWGQPLRFYRWPTRLIRPNGSGATIDLTNAQVLIPTILNVAFAGKDPDDPFSVISTTTEFETQGNPPEPRYHTQGTYHIPLVVSAGPDETLGLYEPFNDPIDPIAGWFAGVSNPADIYDNLTNHNNRAAGH